MDLDFHFSGRRAVILHPAETVREQLSLRLSALGVEAAPQWPELEPEGMDFLFLDIDTGHDDQLPWPAGAAPVPFIGLIGSHSPGRLGWAVSRNINSFLPQSALSDVYAVLVLASARFRERQRRIEADAEIARRTGMRLEVVRAVTAIMREEDLDEARALKKLRAFAMIERLTLEDAALRLLTRFGEAHAAREMRK